jgi:hypothetical protein
MVKYHAISPHLSSVKAHGFGHVKRVRRWAIVYVRTWVWMLADAHGSLFARLDLPSQDRSNLFGKRDLISWHVARQI